jgi:hypothetical protein
MLLIIRTTEQEDFVRNVTRGRRTCADVVSLIIIIDLYKYHALALSSLICSMYCLLCLLYNAKYTF